MPFTLRKIDAFPGIVVLEPKIFRDHRGFFMEFYNQRDFTRNGLNVSFVQDNHSRSKKNVIRGLHFQLPPKAQAKLVRCVRGEVLDVAVDIRKKSPSYGKYFSIRLSEDAANMVYIPKGFAHGFAALTEGAEVLYKTDDLYAPELEAGIIWNDPELAISWGVPVPVLTQKDMEWPDLKQFKTPFKFRKERK